LQTRKVRIKCNWSNSSGGTAGAGAGLYTATLPVTAANIGAAYMGVFGAGFTYESGGTIANMVVGMASTTAMLWIHGSYTSLTGADQSSADRKMSFSGEYEI